MMPRKHAGTLHPALHDSELLAAIVESSDDAIFTKDLEGIITSWNRGAERLYGYTAAEIIGRSVLKLIPADRQHEESDILARLHAGERVDHFETVRLRKDGTPVHISLTVSPLRDEDGNIVGASKIARDITERRRAEEMQRLLLGEMQHRIKNVFALAGSLVSLSVSRAETPAELARMVRARLGALAAAHQLTVPVLDESAVVQDRHLTLHSLVRALTAPTLDQDEDQRLTIAGPDITMVGKSVTPLALVLNELVTNAIKHGALRDDAGRVTFATALCEDGATITWSEIHPESSASVPEGNGFGSMLSRIAVEQQLGGTMTRDWAAGGLTVTITFDKKNIADQA